jgi:hypothetical protein
METESESVSLQSVKIREIRVDLAQKPGIRNRESRIPLPGFSTGAPTADSLKS